MGDVQELWIATSCGELTELTDLTPVGWRMLHGQEPVSGTEGIVSAVAVIPAIQLVVHALVKRCIAA